MITYFVVQAYQRGKRGALVEDAPVPATSAGHACRMAERMANQKAAVVAFSRTCDPDTGDFEDAVVLAAYGALPDELAEKLLTAA